MRIPVNINTSHKYSNVPVGHLFTLVERWPLFLKTREGAIIVGDGGTGKYIGSEYSKYECNDIEVTWMSPEPVWFVAQ